MHRTLTGTVAAVLASATLLAGCGAEDGGSNVEPAIDDPAVTEDGPDEATEEPSDEDMATMDGMETTDG